MVLHLSEHSIRVILSSHKNQPYREAWQNAVWRSSSALYTKRLRLSPMNLEQG